jgi:hypothetical protein
MSARLFGSTSFRFQIAAAPPTPAWVHALDRLRSPGAAALGVALLGASGALAIAAATPVPAAQAVALLVFSAVSCLGVAAPLLLWLALGEKVQAPLGRLRGLLVRYDAQILTVVLAALGLVVIFSAATAAAAPTPPAAAPAPATAAAWPAHGAAPASRTAGC